MSNTALPGSTVPGLYRRCKECGSPPTELGWVVPMAKTVWWPIGYISVNQPLMLLIQGTDDPVVRPELTDDFVQKMRQAGANIEYL